MYIFTTKCVFHGLSLVEGPPDIHPSVSLLESDPSECSRLTPTASDEPEKLYLYPGEHRR